jgi:hypothetical protein
VRRIGSLLLVGLAWAPPATALDLALTGSIVETVTAADLTGGAGTGLRATFDASTVDVEVSTTTAATDAWRIDVRRSGAAWDDGLRVWVRRTDAGSGPGTVAEGTSWIEVGPIDTPFFEGTGDRTGVSVQVRISGVSLALSPDAYASVLHYTLVDVP